MPVNVANSNYSLLVSLPESLYPMSQVDFTVTLNPSNAGISLRKNPTVVSFYPDNVVTRVDLTINDATAWVVGATTNLIFTPVNTNTYAMGASIPLTAIASAGVPTSTLTAENPTVNSLSFTASCSQ